MQYLIKEYSPDGLYTTTYTSYVLPVGQVIGRQHNTVLLSLKGGSGVAVATPTKQSNDVGFHGAPVVDLSAMFGVQTAVVV